MTVSATPATPSGTPSAPPSTEPSRTAGSHDPNCRGGLDVQGVTITYNNGHTALRDATFCTPPGSITALVGVNGSGKSTLFKAIMGFLKPAAGHIEVLGRSVAEAIHRNQVAYVPQNEEVDWAVTGTWVFSGVRRRPIMPRWTTRCSGWRCRTTGCGRSVSCRVARRSACFWHGRWPSRRR